MTLPTSNALDHVGPIFRRILLQGVVLVVALAVVGGLVGLLLSGTPGLVGGLIGAVMSVVFLGLTAASVLVGLRLSHGQMISGAFFGTVMGTFLVKFILFIVVLVALKGQPWVDSKVLGVAIIVGVVASLVIDVSVIARSRVPIDVRLPGDDADRAGRAGRVGGLGGEARQAPEDRATRADGDQPDAGEHGSGAGGTGY